MQNIPPFKDALENYQALRDTTTEYGTRFTVRGRLTPGDGGSGTFEDIGTVASLSGITDDDGYHLFTTGGTRVARRQGKVKPEHYGGTGYESRAAAVSSGVNNTPHFTAMEAARNDWEAEWQVDKIYPCSTTVQIANYGSNITMTGALLFPSGGQVTGFEIVDPTGKDQDGNTPIYTGIRVLKGPQGSSNWMSYGYGNTMAKEGDPAILQTWNETDIGIRTVAQTNLTMVNPEVMGFAIGYCTDTETSGGSGSEASWNVLENLITYQTRVGHLVRARSNRAVAPETGWANQFRFSHLQTNGLPDNGADSSSYGFVVMGNPTIPVSDRHKVNGIIFYGSHEGKANEAGGQELAPLVIMDGQGIDATVRNDTPDMIFRVFDRPTADAVSGNLAANTDIIIRPHIIWNSTQFEINTGTNVRIHSPGTIDPQILLVDASDIRRRMVPDGLEDYRAQGPYLAFADSTISAEPLDKMWKVLCDVNLDGTVNTQAAAANRGGIGARIHLGTRENYGGSLVVNVETTGSNTLGALCYDANGQLITQYPSGITLPSGGWLIRDCRPERGAATATWIQDGDGFLNSAIATTGGSKGLRFHHTVAEAFVVVQSTALRGFQIFSDNMPGCRAVEITPDMKVADAKPSFGTFKESTLILNADPGGYPRGWLLNSTLGPSGEVDAYTDYVSGMVVNRMGHYLANGEIWRPTAGFLTGQANSTETSGTDFDGTQVSPFVDDAGITWTRWKTGPITEATFEPFNVAASGVPNRKEDADILPSGSGTETINFDDGLYDNKVVTVIGAYSPSWTPTRIGMYSLTLNMDATGGHTVTFPTMVGTPPIVNMSGFESTELLFFWNGSESVVISTDQINDQGSSDYLDVGSVRQQWGISGNPSGGEISVSLPVAFADSSYSVVVTSQNTGSTTNLHGGVVHSKTTTDFDVSVYADTGAQSILPVNWFAVGAKP